jgi:hypothetical protein
MTIGRRFVSRCRFAANIFTLPPRAVKIDQIVWVARGIPFAERSCRHSSALWRACCGLRKCHVMVDYMTLTLIALNFAVAMEALQKPRYASVHSPQRCQ